MKYSLLFIFYIGTVFIYANSHADPLVIDEDAFEKEINLSTTSSRLPQKEGAEPVPVTIIDRETIERSGFNNIIVLFRLVPGMLPTYLAGNTPLLQRHGSADFVNNNLLVMLDGRPVYTALLNNVDWQTLPINIHDIEKIEISRSPNSSIYGSNAFKGSINIITKKPHQETGTSILTTQGSRDTKNYFIRSSEANGDWHNSISLTAENDTGFKNVHDDNKTTKLFLQADKNTPNDTFSIQAGVTESRNTVNIEYVHPYAAEPVKYNIDSYFTYINWMKRLSPSHGFTVKAHHTKIDKSDTYKTILLSSILGIDPADVFATIGKPDQQITFSSFDAITRTSGFEVFFNNINTKNINYNIGYSLNHDNIKSPRWFSHNNWIENNTHQLFTQLNYKPNHHHVINSSLLLEKNNFTKTQTSYRLSYLYKPEQNHTLRFSTARANQLPDNIHINSFHSANYADGDIVKLHYVGNKDIKHAQNDIIEIGYHYHKNHKTHIDINLFNYKITDFISVKEDNTNLYPYDFNNQFFLLSNTGSYQMQGIEVQNKYSITNNSYLQLFYTYLDAAGKTSRHVLNNKFLDHNELTPHQIYGLLTGLNFYDGWSTNIGMYHVDALKTGNGIPVKPYTRIDFNLQKKMNIGGIKGNLSFIAHNIGDEYTEYYSQSIQDTTYYINLKLQL